MTKKDLVRIIREVVRREIKSVVKSEINEALNILEQQDSNKKVAKKSSNKKYTNNSMLNEVLNNTAGFNSQDSTNEWPEISQAEIRNRFAGMQGGVTPQTDINNRPVNTSNLDPSLNKALNRNYSELVKRFK
jgi:predicted RecB family endonuclease